MQDLTPTVNSGAPDFLADEAQLDLVQRQTFGYFWDFAHPGSGMAYDRGRSDGTAENDLIAVGGTGFGIMAMLVAVERGWISRQDAVDRLRKILGFLSKADSYNGVFPHFLDGATGKEVAFWADNAGGDLVETSFLVVGFLCARQYFDRESGSETELRTLIANLWENVNWNKHSEDGGALHWHWVPGPGGGLRQKIEGWNECLITYVLAASSPTYPVSASAYHKGWAKGAVFNNGKEYYGVRLPLGPELGGPLFFAHFSFLGLDPRGLKDRYADYWEQNRNHCLINYEHCVRNPNGFKGYGAQCWGLTSSEGDNGYRPHAPDEDAGVIAPTAALSSFPYTPEHSNAALRHFFSLGSKLSGKYGFVDAFNPTTGWYSDQHLAIDQGPIIVMIENHRTGLLWRLFMSCPEIGAGLRLLGFEELAQV
ncbi:MAG: glucoamylase family protein [Rhodomicrobium sp.]